MILKKIERGQNVLPIYVCAECGYATPPILTDADGKDRPDGRYWQPGTRFKYCPMCGVKIEGYEE